MDQTWFKEHFDEILEDYFTLLKMRTVSPDPASKEEMDDASLWLKNYLERSPLKVEIIKNSFNPIIIAESPKIEGAPTVLLYGHYDVQPADPLNEWKRDPFDPALIDGKVFARGASDNKGQVIFFTTAVRAWLEKNSNLNIKICLDGDEERSSKGLFEKMDQLKEKLAADYLLVIDFGILGKNEPSISMGARGVVPLEIEIENGLKDIHSGSHGGIAYNPLKELVLLLTKLWDSDGKIAVPHLYDNVEKVSAQEMSGYELGFDEKKYKEDFGIREIRVQKGLLPKEAVSFWPCIDINGMGGGYAGEGVKTIIPARAFAKISCRLVPNQEPEKVGQLIADFLKKEASSKLKVTVKVLQGGAPFREKESKLSKIVSSAYEEVYKKPCKKTLAGGSVPIVAKMKKLLGVEVVGMGTAFPSDDIHSPNEHFEMECLEKGFLTILAIFKRLALN